MFKVLIVVPYPQLESLVKKVYKESFENENFSPDIMVLRVDELKKLENIDEYKIIIARGMSAKLLKEKFPQKSIIEIPINGYDVMNAVLRAEKEFKSKKIGVFLPNISIHNDEILSKAFGMDIKIFVTPLGKDIDFTKAADEGIDTVVGGYTAVAEGKKVGFNTTLIWTGAEAIYSVFLEMMRHMETINNEEKRNKTYQTILKESEDGIIYVDENKVIEIINRKAIQLLETEAHILGGEKIKTVFPYLEKMLDKTMQEQLHIHNELMRVGKNMLSFNFESVLVNNMPIGAIITCRSVSKIQEMESEIRKKLGSKGLLAKYHFKDIIYGSENMYSVISKAKKFGMTDSNVLIVGETGTGKELMAQSMHNISQRNNGPFIAVNCAALPENLLESELFGYVEGAFTGSKRGGKLGLFEQANNGTLFLDEISELPINFQGKLLRALQEKQIRRVGDDKVININVRIMAATNKNLANEVEKGNFRQDLMYRLDVLRLYVPPLRKRREDIYLIFIYYIKKYNKKMGTDIRGFTDEARVILENYSFYGNVRELRNIAERVVVTTEENIIDEKTMMEALYPQDVPSVKTVSEEKYGFNKNITESSAIKADSEKEKIICALKQANGRKSKAAEILGVDRSTLWRKMKNYDLK